MKQIKSKVTYILKNFPECRNSDWRVAFKVWEYKDVVFTPEEKRKIMLAHSQASFYTIERQCRKVRAELNLKGSEEVEKGRNTNYFRYLNDSLLDKPVRDWMDK